MIGQSEVRPGTDQVLVHAAQGGDAEAFAELVARHRPWLVGVCRAHLSGDHHAAEDVAQECLVRLHSTLVQCPDRALSVRPWLAVVARHACIDHHRRHRHQPEPVESVPESSAPAEDIFDVDPALAKAWVRLTPRHREVLHHRELIGLSYDDIATLMETSSSGVESLLVRARGALRREYRRAGGRLLGCGAFLFLERSVRGSQPQAEAVAHVASCRACASMLGEIERMAGLLRGVLPHLPQLPARTPWATIGQVTSRLADRWAPFAPLTPNVFHLTVAAVTALAVVTPLTGLPNPPAPAQPVTRPGIPMLRPATMSTTGRTRAEHQVPAVAPSGSPVTASPGARPEPNDLRDNSWSHTSGWAAPLQAWSSPRPSPSPTKHWLPTTWATSWPQPRPTPSASRRPANGHPTG